MQNFYHTHYTAKKVKFSGEKNNKPSMSIPGESYTIEEMFQKFANGVPVRSRILTENDYIQVDHNSENWESVKISSDPLIAMDEAKQRAEKSLKHLNDEVQTNKEARRKVAEEKALKEAQLKLEKGAENG